MAEETCPSCGKELPSELGPHAADLVSATVTCPHCGAKASLREPPAPTSQDYPRAEAAPPGRTEGSTTFSGSETVAGVADELDNKPT